MIDRERLLAPLAGESPAGPNLRLLSGDTTFAELTELRREEDPAVDPDGRGKEADWSGALRLSARVLAERSKDLQIAAHLTEALTRTKGFGGTLDGLRFVRELLDRYWDTLHPGVEDGEVVLALRARWISWLGSSREFLAAVRSVPLTSGPGVPPLSWQDHENTQRVDAAALQSDKRPYEELIASGLVPGSEWKAALGATPLERLRGAVDTIDSCLEEIRGLTAWCEERFGDESPNLVELSNLLGDCRDYLAARIGGGEAPEESADGPAEAAGPESTSAPGARSAGPIASRDEAFRRLKEAADYLRRAEPHSPVPYLVDRAVAWGEMPFRDVLKDVLRDDKAFKSILETLGMSD